MAISLNQSRALNDLATLLYGFLPGEPHPYADPGISFAGVARSLGLQSFWPGGSKRPAIASLLSKTYELRTPQLCPLILEVIRKGMIYRETKGSPITRREIKQLNALLKELNFKIPELVDPRFVDSLPSQQRDEAPGLNAETRNALAKELIALATLDPQKRGYAFGKFLNRQFTASGLAPREPFRLIGEQIDGSIQLEGETYLVEATWRNSKVGYEELLAFAGKVEGKASWSRGLMISYAGFTTEGLAAFSRGRRTAIVCMEGLDFHETLERGLHLPTVISAKARKAAETNEAFVPVRNLFPEVK